MAGTTQLGTGERNRFSGAFKQEKRFKTNMAGEIAVDGTVKKPSEVTTPPASEDAVKLAELQVKYDELEIEKNNYRKGMLAAKGKLPDDQEDPDEKVRRIIREENATSREAQIALEQKAIVAELTRKNTELVTALRNKAQPNIGTGQGSSTEDPKKPDAEFFSTEALAEFKRKGFDDAKIARIKENYLKQAGMPVYVNAEK